MNFTILLDTLKGDYKTVTVNIASKKLVYDSSKKRTSHVIYQENEELLDKLFAQYAAKKGMAYVEPVFDGDVSE